MFYPQLDSGAHIQTGLVLAFIINGILVLSNVENDHGITLMVMMVLAALWEGLQYFTKTGTASFKDFAFSIEGAVMIAVIVELNIMFQ